MHVYFSVSKWSISISFVVYVSLCLCVTVLIYWLSRSISRGSQMRVSNDVSSSGVSIADLE